MTRSAYFAPILAYGKTSAKLSTDATIAAGAVSIGVDNTDDAWALDDNLFISENDESETQFLGAVESIATNKLSVTVDIPVSLSKGANARLWKPTTSYELQIGPGAALARRALTGVRTRVSRGGQVFSTRTSDNVNIVEFRYDSEDFGRAFDWQGVVDWLRTNRRGGLDSFTLAYWDPYEQENGAPKADEVRAFDVLAGGEGDSGHRSELVRPDLSTSGKWAAAHNLRFIIINEATYKTS
jgi:hypothetical protein